MFGDNHQSTITRQRVLQPMILSSSSFTECGNQRIYSRSLSWNASGSYLAMGSSDRVTRIWSVQELSTSATTTTSTAAPAATTATITPASSVTMTASTAVNARDILTLAGHAGIVDRVRFHPTQDFLLATTCTGDGTVRLWDVRGATSKPIGRIDMTNNTNEEGGINRTAAGSGGGGGGGATDISWSPKPSVLAVTGKNGSVHVLDTRQLSSNQAFNVSSSKSVDATSPSVNGIGSASSNSALLRSFSLRDTSYVDGCIFSPSGHHLVAATTSNYGYGEITCWNWEELSDGTFKEQNNDPNCADHFPVTQNRKFVYPAHTGPIYTMAFSPDGNHLATGGGDALVGLWDVDSMVMTNTITRCPRFIRSVSFSHDSKFVATSTEDETVDVAMADSGTFVGKVSLNGGRSRGGGGPAGADEIDFHPKSYLLACSRCDSVVHAPLSIVKLQVEAL